jgi:hypothetical protein
MPGEKSWGEAMPYRAIRSARNVLLILGLMVLMAPPVHAGARDVFATGFDVVFLRPLGVVRTAVGAILFFPFALVTLPAGPAKDFDSRMDSAREGFDLFVATPARYTFVRPLGDL